MSCGRLYCLCKLNNPQHRYSALHAPDPLIDRVMYLFGHVPLPLQLQTFMQVFRFQDRTLVHLWTCSFMIVCLLSSPQKTCCLPSLRVWFCRGIFKLYFHLPLFLTFSFSPLPLTARQIQYLSEFCIAGEGPCLVLLDKFHYARDPFRIIDVPPVNSDDVAVHDSS